MSKPGKTTAICSARVSELARCTLHTVIDCAAGAGEFEGGMRSEKANALLSLTHPPF